MALMNSRAKATVHIENDRVTVTEWSIPPGAATGLHRHTRDYVVVPRTDGRLELAQPGAETLQADLIAGVPYYRDAGVEHDVRNIGDSIVVFIEVEIE
jgi:mannose-6-phosphate isomerase-like protein (cupin superfamily)